MLLVDVHPRMCLRNAMLRGVSKGSRLTLLNKVLFNSPFDAPLVPLAAREPDIIVLILIDTELFSIVTHCFAFVIF